MIEGDVNTLLALSSQLFQEEFANPNYNTCYEYLLFLKMDTFTICYVKYPFVCSISLAKNLFEIFSLGLTTHQG